MNYKYLNEMIDYIEQHLTEEIDYTKLSKIVGVNSFILQRIFVFLTDITLAEYIRKRRLSKAYEELVTTDNLVIDIAIKYQYDSPISFARAFKSMYGITPSQCKKNKNKFKLFPKIVFNKNFNDHIELDYEIVELNDIYLNCFEVFDDVSHDDMLNKIKNLYTKLMHKNIYEKMNINGMYAISSCENQKRVYKLGSSKYFPNTKKEIIPKGKYLKFNVGSRLQKDIANIAKKIYREYLPSTKFSLNNKFDIEYYENNNCYIYIPIKINKIDM